WFVYKKGQIFVVHFWYKIQVIMLIPKFFDLCCCIFICQEPVVRDIRLIYKFSCWLVAIHMKNTDDLQIGLCQYLFYVLINTDMVIAQTDMNGISDAYVIFFGNVVRDQNLLPVIRLNMPAFHQLKGAGTKFIAKTSVCVSIHIRCNMLYLIKF